MHGGAKDAGGRNSNFEFGLWTREEVGARTAARARMHGIRAYLKAASSGRA